MQNQYDRVEEQLIKLRSTLMDMAVGELLLSKKQHVYAAVDGLGKAIFAMRTLSSMAKPLKK